MPPYGPLSTPLRRRHPGKPLRVHHFPGQQRVVARRPSAVQSVRSLHVGTGARTFAAGSGTLSARPRARPLSPGPRTGALPPGPRCALALGSRTQYAHARSIQYGSRCRPAADSAPEVSSGVAALPGPAYRLLCPLLIRAVISPLVVSLLHSLCSCSLRFVRGQVPQREAPRHQHVQGTGAHRLQRDHVPLHQLRSRPRSECATETAARVLPSIRCSRSLTSFLMTCASAVSPRPINPAGSLHRRRYQLRGVAVALLLQSQPPARGRRPARPSASFSIGSPLRSAADLGACPSVSLGPALAVCAQLDEWNAEAQKMIQKRTTIMTNPMLMFVVRRRPSFV